MGNSRYDYALWSNSKHVKIYLTPCHNVETSSLNNISMFSIARHFPFDHDIIYIPVRQRGGGGEEGDGGHSSPLPHAPRFSAISIVSKY